MAEQFGRNTVIVGGKEISPERSTHCLVVHLWLVLVQTPQPGDSLGVDELEDAASAVRPLDVARTVFVILQQLEQELPQVRATCTRKHTTSITRST